MEFSPTNEDVDYSLCSTWTDILLTSSVSNLFIPRTSTVPPKSWANTRRLFGVSVKPFTYIVSPANVIQNLPTV